ncbi:hypothetical protein DTL21_17135 [Bremerella cremea]|uniref:Rho termination factor N-terminal domain-containing protein n=1 Tax=Blastopirellula marina TaxID=124 RepID=A0A2S8FIK5_9BACT|nr:MULTISPECIES: hypothetical protein [Pirellulaceae]PQO31973.1 hypothetical protein C5Y83_17120 [Blastopirellula marina]RCS45040.1 hypothetical protein DTL21_17135 [Bremerella cremea]
MSTIISPSADPEVSEETTATMGASTKRLEDHTVKELRELASRLGIRGRSKIMHKEELVSIIRRRW